MMMAMLTISAILVIKSPQEFSDAFVYSWPYLVITQTPWNIETLKIIFLTELLKVPPDSLSSYHFVLYEYIQTSFGDLVV